uniref:Uncharacterized protein n=1 Tax=Elphidium margaritaceum TaxID=933848 RepID=A0A7S0THS4_9EUKA
MYHTTAAATATTAHILNIVNVARHIDYQRLWNAMRAFDLIVRARAIAAEQFCDDDWHSLMWLLQSRCPHALVTSMGHSSSSSGSGVSGGGGTRNHAHHSYMDACFAALCQHFVSAEVSLCAWPYMTFVVYPLLFDEYGWIRLEVWCALLSNAQRIRVDQVILCERIFDDLYTFLLRFQAKRRGAIHSSMQRLCVCGGGAMRVALYDVCRVSALV